MHGVAVSRREVIRAEIRHAWTTLLKLVITSTVGNRMFAVRLSQLGSAEPESLLGQ